MSEENLNQEELRERREFVFLLLAGFFICSMTLLNVIGNTRFVQLGPMQLAVGVLQLSSCSSLLPSKPELTCKLLSINLLDLGLRLRLVLLGSPGRGRRGRARCGRWRGAPRASLQVVSSRTGQDATHDVLDESWHPSLRQATCGVRGCWPS